MSKYICLRFCIWCCVGEAFTGCGQAAAGNLRVRSRDQGSACQRHNHRLLNSNYLQFFCLQLSFREAFKGRTFLPIVVLKRYLCSKTRSKFFWQFIFRLLRVKSREQTSLGRVFHSSLSYCISVGFHPFLPLNSCPYSCIIGCDMGNSLKVKRSVDNPLYTFDFILCRTRFLSQVIASKTDISIYPSSIFLFKVCILLKCRKFLQR